MDVQGLRCLVTGAASGIGEEVATRLTAGGATVTSLDVKPPSARVDSHVECDLADPRSIDEAVSTLGPGWDVLCNVAGLPGTASAEAVMKVNFLGPRHLTESLLGGFAEGASIVNVASMAGFGWPERIGEVREFVATESFQDGLRWWEEHQVDGSAYNFSKEAVIVYTMTMGLALGELGHRINAISPGPVETPILGDFEETMGKDTLDGVRDLIGRHALPGDIAPGVVFLASRDSRWFNGINAPADAGIGGAVYTGLVPRPEV